MKVAVAFVLFLAGVMAMPSQPMPSVHEVSEAFRHAVDTKDGRVVDGIITNMINNLVQRIRDAGLDPINVQEAGASYAILDDFKVYADVLEFHLSGLSSIHINRITFSIFTFTLNFDIQLNGIDIGAANAAAGVDIDGYGNYGASIGGTASVNTLRAVGTARVGLVPSITIRDIELNVSLGNIASDLTIKILSADYSSQVNEFLNVTLPALLADNSAAINDILNRVVIWIINTIL